MKSEETTILNKSMENENEETQVMNEETQLTDETTVADAQQPTKEGNRISWKQVAIGGVSGILMGAASTLMMGATMPDKENTENGGDEVDDPIAPTPVSGDTYTTVEGLPVATVSDDMSFGEAFAAARAEVGAGGVFEWHGNVYNTYYAEEWNAMTPEQQAEFGERINYGGPTAQAQETAETPHHTAHNTTTNTTTNQEVAHTEEPEEVADVDIQVLGVESVTFDDGSEGNVAVVEMGGQNVFLVDANNDNVFEGAFGDLNNDGVISDNEVADVSAAGMTVSDLQQQMVQQQSDLYMADMPDYTNDADPSAFYDA